MLGAILYLTGFSYYAADFPYLWTSELTVKSEKRVKYLSTERGYCAITSLPLASKNMQ